MPTKMVESTFCAPAYSGGAPSPGGRRSTTVLRSLPRAACTAKKLPCSPCTGHIQLLFERSSPKLPSLFRHTWPAPMPPSGKPRLTRQST